MGANRLPQPVGSVAPATHQPPARLPVLMGQIISQARLDKRSVVGQNSPMTKTETKWQGELTNSCTCLRYDHETEQFTDEPSETCYGDCWEDAVYLFAEETKVFRDANPTDEWRVSGLPLWNRSVDGVFTATTVQDFIRGVTVRGEWHLRYRVDGDHLHLNLSHHDVPMGRSFSVTYGE